MTSDELLRLIEQDAASHRLHDCDEVHRYQAPIVTIGTLVTRAGRPRRAIEEAIQQARLEGVPIITDGGIRVAQTAEQAHDLAGWLFARIRSQRETAEAIQAKAVEWEKAPDLTLGLQA